MPENPNKKKPAKKKSIRRVVNNEYGGECYLPKKEQDENLK